MQLQKDEFDKILSLLMQKGIDDMDLSMFDDDIRIQLLKNAAERFFDDKKYLEAIKAYGLVEDKEKLNKLGDMFLKSCLLANALLAYEIAENKIMVQFIKQNFDEGEYCNKIYI